MKVLFMGTPEFAVPTLEAIMQKHEVVAAVTQPDKPKGRGNKVQFSPVKQFCITHNIPVLQPKRIKNKSWLPRLAAYQADVFVVVAYGQILPETILSMPRYNCLNVHGSLLPKYRGAAPIQWAIINGESKTGVTIMEMDAGIDTGDMLLQKEIDILPEDTGGSLHDKMAIVGAEALLEVLKQIEAGTVQREKQDHSQHTYAPILEKDMGQINWNQTSTQIVNQIRGLNPWPSAYSNYAGKVYKIWSAQHLDRPYTGAVGEIVAVEKNGVVVKAGDGAVLLTEWQVQGGKRMAVGDYLRGHALPQGELFQ